MALKKGLLSKEYARWDDLVNRAMVLVAAGCLRGWWF